MQSDTSPFGLRGFLIDAPQFGTLRGRPNGAVLIDNGKISKIGDYDDLLSDRVAPIALCGHGGCLGVEVFTQRPLTEPFNCA